MKIECTNPLSLSLVPQIASVGSLEMRKVPYFNQRKTFFFFFFFLKTGRSVSEVSPANFPRSNGCSRRWGVGYFIFNTDVLFFCPSVLDHQVLRYSTTEQINWSWDKEEDRVNLM